MLRLAKPANYIAVSPSVRQRARYTNYILNVNGHNNNNYTYSVHTYIHTCTVHTLHVQLLTHI